MIDVSKLTIKYHYLNYYSNLFVKTQCGRPGHSGVCVPLPVEVGGSTETDSVLHSPCVTETLWRSETAIKSDVTVLFYLILHYSTNFYHLLNLIFRKPF